MLFRHKTATFKLLPTHKSRSQGFESSEYCVAIGIIVNIEFTNASVWLNAMANGQDIFDYSGFCMI
ncbi:protein of unknown function [Candidatus Filomicrobium marinum]|uniref:Uncharacterized protein n=1 Tax=Candidatus Filomicrobium marinum TaxID=1608628 RepID=A0A0D6JG98_9HYPH|nr:protein of unknown function [Candidatus Filomicrobium marinum]CPR19307.1 protein of unknown function [Candidatus Filomicrobium marinum]